MKVGDVFSWERLFTEEDIVLFTTLSGDAGEHHVKPDERGRLMAQGLLTATLPTKIGGDLNFIARELNFQFHRPVFAGDTVRCDATIVAIAESEQYTRVSFEWVCRNQLGKDVLTGHAHGVIRSRASD